ncbi:transposase [Nocardia sp. NPDC004604]|uniref:RNA-guided endonuclease InsQ/TnpB family protein n=1 Tax=Nocardia sp. NPDC004604 TaxID=3157013 RepID=UPI0033B42038
MLVGRRYQLELTPLQEQACTLFGSICRSVWNTGLEQRRAYQCRGAWMNYSPQAAELADAKTEHAWLRAAPSHILQQTLIDLDRACRERGTFRVRWRSSRRWSPSFRFPDPKQIIVQRLGRKRGQARLPKLGWVRFRWSRSLGGTIRSATVSCDGGRWFVSFLVNTGLDPTNEPDSRTAAGVDRGVKVAVAVSDGTMYNRKFDTPGERRRYRRLQRRLARQVNGSANRHKTLVAMRSVRRRQRQRRADFCAYTANRLAVGNSVVVIEDLPIRNMIRSARGTVEQPGTNVRQKAGLNRAILDKGWHKFELALRNVARRTGCLIVKVPPQYTSQRCSVCGFVDSESRESQAVFRCTSCGYIEHADVNAAKNILAAGLAVTACGDLQPLGGSVKQEPTGNREELLFGCLPIRERSGIPQLRPREEVKWSRHVGFAGGGFAR